MALNLQHLTHWRQHVALDVGTASIRIATGMSTIIERLSKIGNRFAMRGGVVADPEAVTQILKPMMDRSRVFGIVRPCVLTCAPSDVRKHERQLLIEAVKSAGAASVVVIPEPLAAAIGAGLDVSSPFAQMVVDIGEGVTDCAVVSSSKILATAAIRIGCGHMRLAVDDVLARHAPVKAGRPSGDTILHRYGITGAGDNGCNSAVNAALLPVINEIAGMINEFLKGLPPQTGCEVIESGICLTGGGALLPGGREFIEQKTGITVFTAKNPRVSVVEGARSILPVVMYLNQWK